jgi:hypothetical protein
MHLRRTPSQVWEIYKLTFVNEVVSWDGKSRVPDKTYKENYDSIDWSYVKKEKKK